VKDEIEKQLNKRSKLILGIDQVRDTGIANARQRRRYHRCQQII
jgi:hypothetical protein